MRYRKSIKIGKGVKVNLSKSGLSMSTGIPGLSVTTGKRGTYLNAGIPGTGIYDRKKIGGGSRASSSRNSAKGTTAQSFINYKVSVDDEKNISFLDMSDQPITDPNLISKIKRSPQFKELKAEIDWNYELEMSKKSMEADAKMDDIIHINWNAAKVLSEDDLKNQFQEAKPERYIRKVFKGATPDKNLLMLHLKSEASSNVKGIFGKKKKIDEYINARLEPMYADKMNKWQLEKNDFEKHEDEVEKKANAEFNAAFEESRLLYEKAFNADEQAIETIVNNLVGNIELPLEFSLDYEYTEDKTMWVDLDLPEIEDLPKTKYVILKSGVTKQKAKTQKEEKEDYARCVFGIGIYFASVLLNVSPAIEKICISGYTQRRNKSGDICDEYVYSLLLPRNEMMKMNLNGENAIDIAMKFKNRCNMTSTFQLKTIVPYSKEDIE